MFGKVRQNLQNEVWGLSKKKIYKIKFEKFKLFPELAIYFGYNTCPRARVCMFVCVIYILYCICS